MQENAFIGIGPDLVKLFSGALLHVQSAFADSRRSGVLGERTRTGCGFGVAPERIFRNIFGSILNLGAVVGVPLELAAAISPWKMSVDVSINVDS